MTKISKAVVVFLVSGILAAGLSALIVKFKGAAPALLPPSADISKLFDARPVSSTGPIALPAGYEINIYAKNLDAPRVLAQDTAGNVLVSSPSAGKIFLLNDGDRNGTAEQTNAILSGLDKPHGILVDCSPQCYLFVVEETRLMRYDYQPIMGQATNPKKLLDIPKGGRHTTRTILKLDNQLLISIGSTCDQCVEENPWHGSIVAANLDGSNARIYARGLRNSVFMTRHPATGQVYATEMGHDKLGDDSPPDEINVISENKNYGWPICYGKNIHDNAFDKNTYIQNPCMEPNQIPSFIDLPAHVAPLGIEFITAASWPQALRNDALVAYHGSWDRDEPVGYKIVRVKLSDTGAFEGIDDFATGWLTADGALGRPVDILMGLDEALFVSDDKAGVVYRITYSSSAQQQTQPPQTAKICKRSGCSGEICAATDQASACLYKPEFACYKSATCEVQSNGECGWTLNSQLKSCLARPPQM